MNINNNVCDLSFPISSGIVPLDHGYILYSALSEILPEIHKADWLLIFPLSGKKIGNNSLLLTDTSQIRLRFPLEHINTILKLQNKTIKIKDKIFSLKDPTIHGLKYIKNLFSRKVYINVSDKPIDENNKIEFEKFKINFQKSVEKQLNELNISGNINILGRQRIKIKDNILITFSVLIENLNKEDSIKLQSYGIGGKHKMGCGIFRPAKENK